MLFALCLTLFGACEPESEEAGTPAVVSGLRPIYVLADEAEVVSAVPAQAILNLGKIYYKDKTIYVNESKMGVHIIDNTDPSNPLKTGFLRIPGCNDIAIKDNILYADNVGDLIAVDISDPAHPKVVKRLDGLQANGSDKFPQFFEGYFECVDESKGVVVGWEKAELTNPKCWR